MITKEEAYLKVSELVERFTEQLPSYKKADYNETLTRQDFINPFFKALGWDVDNSFGNAEAYREVIHEDKVKVGGATKAPDYSFRLPGGHRLFFVEAKKPSVVVRDEILPAYQVRRYGWSAKLPISLITDFEEFAIYDCTKKPNPTDKASHGRIKYLTFKDYLNEFDFIWDTFSKERVLKGSFDKFVKSDTNKKGTATVDKDFLASLDEWRKQLAVNIALRNQHLSEDDLNFVVQQTLDRIIFLRIAEDRGVEEYGELKSIFTSPKTGGQEGTYYQQLYGLFKEADSKYNSGLFDFKKDHLSHSINIDNKVIKSIINELYYPISPYEFSVLSVEILGSAYEQFLGKQIKLDKNHRAVIEEKPEVRKAGGVYYTPQYIVEYIVQNTIGKLTEGKTPEQVSNLTIVDPACGSGSFLLGAYDYLMKWHLLYYKPEFTELSEKAANGNLYNTKQRQDFIKQRNKLPLTPEGFLTTALKKQILLNNIYGVDIDTQAVEVTKLSLLLKCMEGETASSINAEMHFGERALPTLDSNIKSGNSLIDLDFYDTQIDFGEDKKIKPFNWQQAFANVFKNEGFDVVIGNPPYVMLQILETREVFNYALEKFNSAKYKIDTYQLFIEQSIKLLKKGGLLGFITPNTFLNNIHAQPLRRYILDNVIIKEILLFNYSVFLSASVDTCVFTFEKGIATKRSALIIKQSNNPFEVREISQAKQLAFEESNRNNFNLSVSERDTVVLSKIISASKPLSTFCSAYFGIQTFEREKYVSTEKKNKNYEPVIDGGNIDSYRLKPPKEFVNYIPSSIKSGGNEAIYRQDRICIRQIGAYPIATYVPANIFTLNTVYNVYLKEKGLANLKFILGIINSKVTAFYWRKTNSDEKKTFPKIKKEAILSIQIPEIKEDIQKKLADEIIQSVNSMLSLHQQKQATSLPEKIELLNQRIAYTDEKINKLVYELYGLSEEEIGIVEGR